MDCFLHVVLQPTSPNITNSPFKAKELTVSITPWYIVTWYLYTVRAKLQRCPDAKGD